MAGLQDKAEQYANWLVSNQDKKETDEWQTVSQAYAQVRREMVGSLSQKSVPEENINMFADAVGAGVAGFGRGAIGTLELPEMAGRALLRGGQEALQAAGFDVGEDLPIFDTKTGRVLRSGVEAVGLGDELDYRGQTTAGKFAGTIAEFAGGAGALGAAGKAAKATGKFAQGFGSAAPVVGRAGESLSAAGSALQKAGLSAPAQATAVVAGAGSEAAGQMVEGSIFEPAARVAGALATPAAAAKTFNLMARPYDKLIKPRQMAKNINTGVNYVDEALGKAITQPTYKNQLIAKNAAYKAADNLGDAFSPIEISGMAEGARSRLFAAENGMTKFNPKLDDHISRALERIDDAATTSTGFIGLDTLKRDLYSIYKKGSKTGEKPYDPRLRSIIDDVDDLMATKAQGSRLMNAARLANKRLRKSEVLRDKLAQAELSAASSGSGGNTLNRYKQVINKLMTDKRSSAYFDEGELRAMDAIVRGTIGSDVLRKLGGLSPTADNMRALIGSVLAILEPVTMTVSATGFASKFLSDKGIKSQLTDLDRFLSTGISPTKLAPQMAPRTLGLAPQLPQEQQ